jgi:hypothetical protein
MTGWTVEVRVGRLVEGRPLALKTKEDAIAYADAFRRLVPGLKRGVICADYRAVAVFPPVVADELARLMSDMNPYIERSAILVAAEHATNALQVQRVVRETHNENRRRFTDRNELEHWLGEVLTPAEQARLKEFLS